MERKMERRRKGGKQIQWEGQGLDMRGGSGQRSCRKEKWSKGGWQIGKRMEDKEGERLEKWQSTCKEKEGKV